MERHRRPVRNLTLAIWNATGVNHKKRELELFIQQHSIDVVLLTETHLKPYMPFKLRNMFIYRTDRLARAGGGTAICIRRSLAHHVVPIPPLLSMEATAVQIHTNTQDVTFVATYLRPPETFHRQDLEHLLRLGAAVFIGGDLNAKHVSWNCRQTNPKGEILHELETVLPITVHSPDKPTYTPPFRNQLPDILDIAVTKDVRADFQLHTVTAMSSNHDPVVTCLRPLELPAPPFTQRVINWQQFQRRLTNSVDPHLRLEDARDVDSAITYLTRKITSATRAATTTTRLENALQSESLPPLLEELKHQKNRFRKRWQRFRDPRDRRVMNSLQRQFKHRLAEWRQELWDDKMDNFLLQGKDEWQLIKALKNEKQPRRAINTPHGLSFDPLTIAETFATTYEEQNTLPLLQLTQREHVEEMDTRHRVERYLHRAPVSPPLLTTASEVRNVIKARKGTSAPGLDGVTNDQLKHLPRKPLVLLTRIYNTCLKLHYFPCNWKKAKIVPIPKPGKDLRLTENYRPISLLPTMSKILERLLLLRLQPPLHDNHIIRAEQFGFKRKLSAELQVLRLVEHLTTAFNQAKHTAAIFLDWEKAYDKVWVDKLLEKP